MIDPFADDTEYKPLKLDPLHITQKPYKAIINGRKQWCFHLSDGRIVNLDVLATIAGVAQSSMWLRTQELKWNDPEMLSPRRKRKKKVVNLDHIEQGKFQHLSDRPRYGKSDL